MALGAPAAFALAALYVIVQQYRHRYASDFFWLTHFDRVQAIAWLAVILLACDALVEVVRTRDRGAPAAIAPYDPAVMSTSSDRDGLARCRRTLALLGDARHHRLPGSQELRVGPVDSIAIVLLSVRCCERRFRRVAPVASPTTTVPSGSTSGTAPGTPAALGATVHSVSNTSPRFAVVLNVRDSVALADLQVRDDGGVVGRCW